MSEAKKNPVKDREEREAALREAQRAEAHARATDAAPVGQAGTDLIEENAERVEARKRKK
ncbi:MAG: hypothetical protein ABW167_05205 [Baekduia sp.]